MDRIDLAMAQAALRIRVRVPRDEGPAVDATASDWHRKHGALAVIAHAPAVERHGDTVISGYELYLNDCALDAAHDLRESLAAYAFTGEAQLLYNRPEA